MAHTAAPDPAAADQSCMGRSLLPSSSGSDHRGPAAVPVDQVPAADSGIHHRHMVGVHADHRHRHAGWLVVARSGYKTQKQIVIFL